MIMILMKRSIFIDDDHPIIVCVSEYGICNLTPSQNMIFIVFSLVLGGECSESNNFYAQTQSIHTLEPLQRVSKTDQQRKSQIKKSMYIHFFCFQSTVASQLDSDGAFAHFVKQAADFKCVLERATGEWVWNRSECRRPGRYPHSYGYRLETPAISLESP